ncbi:MAG: alpha/beta fold hydrolase [Terriglobia bacterium]|jgi:alpha-beta hydrolase superfamily lysophospholipase
MTLAIGVVAVLLLIVAAIRYFENSFIYSPPRYPEGFPHADLSPLHVEDVWLTTQDNIRLNAWYLPSPGSEKALLWFHGNAENIGYGLGHAVFYSRLGVNVLAVDYRGYGRSEGSPDEAGVYRDADAAYDYLIRVRHIQPKNIFIYGHSLGGAVAIDLASRRECGGLIVQSSL